jgi:hypothetical protein
MGRGTPLYVQRKQLPWQAVSVDSLRRIRGSSRECIATRQSVSAGYARRFGQSSAVVDFPLCLKWKQSLRYGPRRHQRFDLAEAREKAREYRKLVKEGIDPIAKRDAERAKNLAANLATMTFDQAAEAYIRQHGAAWKSPVHAAQWESTLKTYASPKIGRLSVAEIETGHVVRDSKPGARAH